jgi:hypothetical protein
LGQMEKKKKEWKQTENSKKCSKGSGLGVQGV